MQDINHQRTMNSPQDFFKEAKCQIQKKNSIMKIYHQMNLKQLIKSYLSSDSSQGNSQSEVDLGPCTGEKQEKRELVGSKGSFGEGWASVRIKPGLLFDYKVQILSLKEEVENLKEKSHESSKSKNGKLHLVDNLEEMVETKDLSFDQMGQGKSDSKEKVVFPITIEVRSSLRLEKEVKR